MSFDQLSSLEAGQRCGGANYSDDPDFQRLAQDMMNKLLKLIGNNQRITGEIRHLGTRRDTPRVRERVHELLDESRALFKEVGEGVKKIQTWEDVTPTQKFTQGKLGRDFRTYLSEFQTLQRQAIEKQKASVTAARAALEAEGGVGAAASSETGGGQQLQLQQQQEFSHLASQDEVEFQDALIIEREEEIRNIEQGVGDLNVLFRQVAQIVSEQGEQLDDIHASVVRTRDDTRNASHELRSAARYQKNARGKACCLLLILAVILTIVLLAVLLG